MKKICLIFTLILVGMACNESNDPGTNLQEEQALAKLRKVSTDFSNQANGFAFDLFRKVVADTPDESLMISPLSIHIALGMLTNGTQEASRNQLMEALNFGSFSMQEANDFYSQLLQALPELDTKVQMQIANSVWHDQDFPVKASFLAVLQQHFKAEARSEDFGSPATVDKINNWVSQKTQGRIPNILERINPEHVMFLINAVYFKGDWTHQFEKSDTETATFFKHQGTTTVEMMQQEERLLTAEANDFLAVALPYGNEKFRMTILLPKSELSITEFVADFDETRWDLLQQGLAVRKASVFLPKFKTEFELSLNEALQALGIIDIFSEQLADLSGISEAQNLVVSDVKHKTFIKVDEEGTEAAAVTSIGIEATSFQPPFVVRCDRPFMYVISDTELGSILFQGIYQGD